MAPDTTNNSFMLEIDGGSCYVVGNGGVTAGGWAWVDYQNATAASKVTANLTAGKHTVTFIGTEPSVKVDRVLATMDTACVPAGMGDNCAVAADVTAPTASIGAPADGATVKGAIAVTAMATDNKAVTKVEFYLNNVLKGTVTAAPYAYNWNTAGLANGSYTVAVRAYDAAGNVGADTNTVFVGNGDTQVPTAPANVRATALAHNKVAVTWAASTDNMGVAGYEVTRNGLPLGNVDIATSYTDASAVPNTSYTYRVIARDVANNRSAASAGAVVVTPKVADTQAPSIPAGVKAVAAGVSQVNVTWAASTDNIGVTGYEIYRVNSSGTQKAATVTGTQFGDSGLKAATQYGYYIVAKDAGGNSSTQSLTTYATTATAPATPQPNAPAGVVRGKVAGSQGRALAGVRVALWSGNKRYQATTNASGVYRFEKLPAGRYTVQFKANGYRAEERQLHLRTAKDTAIQNVRMVVQGSQRSWWDRWF